MAVLHSHVPMLALNSYGLAPRPSNNNNHSHSHPERVILPRLCGGAGLPAVREIRSLSKLDMMTHHPLYRTTTDYDYGRYVDLKDAALSCPKFTRPTGFTKEFIAGNYTNYSLLSIEKSKRRAELWQQKMAVRTTQMRVKYEELQGVLEEKRQLRRLEREKRRREMKILRAAVVQLQARMRGYLTRLELKQEKLRRDTEAVLRIQQASRARARVRIAKQELDRRRRERQMVFLVKIQRICRDFLLRRSAKQQLRSLREARQQLEMEIEAQRQRTGAAEMIQRLARGHLARECLRRQTSNAFSSSSDKDDKDTLLSISGRRSRGARRVIAQMQQVRRKNTKVAVRLVGSAK